MGKAAITGGGADGLYQVSLQYKYVRIQKEIDGISAKIAAISAEMAAADADRRRFLEMRLSALAFRNDLLRSILANESDEIWCADLTEDLTGTIGTAEIPNENISRNILPGYEGNVYDPEVHGQVESPSENTPSGSVFNFAVRPFWQRFHPLYRYGTAKNIDVQTDTCDVDILPALSTSQKIDINLKSALTGVPIAYMNCNARAFETGDTVLVRFDDQSWDSPVVIGFRSHPKACEIPNLKAKIGIDTDLHIQKLYHSPPFCVIGIGTLNPKYFIVWDCDANEIKEIRHPVTDAVIQQPCSGMTGDGLDWWNATQSVSASDIYSQNFIGHTPTELRYPNECGGVIIYPVGSGLPDNRTLRICSENEPLVDWCDKNYFLDSFSLCEQVCDFGTEIIPPDTPCGYDHYIEYDSDRRDIQVLNMTTGANYSGYSKKLTLSTNAAYGEMTYIRTSYQTSNYGWGYWFVCADGTWLNTNWGSCGSRTSRAKHFPPHMEPEGIILETHRTDEVFDFSAKYCQSVMIQMGVEEHRNVAGTGVNRTVVACGNSYSDGATNHDPRNQTRSAALETAIESMIAYARTQEELAAENTIKYMFHAPNYISSGYQYGYINIWFKENI